MKNIFYNVIVCAIVVMAVIYTHFFVSWWWFHVAVEGRTFRTSWDWLDMAQLIVWAFEFVWGIGIGIVVGILVRSTSPFWWALACGIVTALAEFALTKHFFYATTPASTYFWAYGVYFMPILGSAMGAYLAVVVRSLKKKETVYTVSQK